MKNILFLFLLILICINAGKAQETQPTFDLTLQGANQIMAAAVQYATSHHAPGAAITIVDDAGTMVLMQRMDGTFLISSEISYHKAQSAALFRFPTSKLEDNINNGRFALLSTGETSLKGGIPIVYHNNVIGAIGVSGAATADQDVEIATAGLTAAFLNEQ
ncbi:MAG: heme-binding protein [Saprospiraceae bacterium]|uniref:Heme-binding protein n=1 Tax=Candidatus Opimibacter skivensis TaxID=2982028 RepID=A0A9D7SX88_9BACT|nr:heme-binding protein [Candidatus Opimibacter skivensis]